MLRIQVINVSRAVPQHTAVIALQRLWICQQKENIVDERLHRNFVVHKAAVEWEGLGTLLPKIEASVRTGLQCEFLASVRPGSAIETVQRDTTQLQLRSAVGIAIDPN